MSVGQLGLLGALQRVPVALAAAAAAAATIAWGVLRAVPFGPQMRPPNPIVAGAPPPAEVPSEGILQRQLLRDLGVGAAGPPGILRVDQIAFVPAPFAPAPEQACQCTAHGAGVAGGVCTRQCGCYVPTHMCLLCATVSSLTAGGGV